MSKVTISCLGIFRDLGDSFEVEVASLAVADIRIAVDGFLVSRKRPDLCVVLKRSVFADGDELLNDSMTAEGTAVSLLPPIAGG